MTKTYLIALAVITALLIILYVVYRTFYLKHICQSLGDWSLFVNTTNCGYCVKQIEYLGQSGCLEYINVVHCDDAANKSACDALKSPGLPTWKKGPIELPGARLSTDRLAELIDK